ncbi:hypothetical protein TSAR_009356 [Trichomalopsis sarcophagae]|uniref:Uncharacterized protein n=1 Tax=Trichomalopsis sarcophagae TaxID=543379 RepID=A0A232EX12_9HYME|nr:hypothetical protein TSAR_009356 [Trichomalopsis sarcophagae]
MAPAARLSLANPGVEQKELAPTYNCSAQCAGLSPSLEEMSKVQWLSNGFFNQLGNLICTQETCHKLCTELGSFSGKCGSWSHTSYSCDCTKENGEVDLIRIVN